MEKLTKIEKASLLVVVAALTGILMLIAIIFGATPAAIGATPTTRVIRIAFEPIDPFWQSCTCYLNNTPWIPNLQAAPECPDDASARCAQASATYNAPASLRFQISCATGSVTAVSDALTIVGEAAATPTPVETVTPQATRTSTPLPTVTPTPKPVKIRGVMYCPCPTP